MIFAIPAIALALTFAPSGPTHADFFPDGGLDQYSYVHWPSTPPDPQPLKLVNQNRRTEAFEYCYKRIDSSSGELRTYYVVQASSLAVRLKKPHVVAEKMAKAINAKVLKAGQANRHALVLEEEWLRYGYAIAMCAFLSNDPDSDYQAWSKARQAWPLHEHRQYAQNLIPKLSFQNVENRYLKATIVFTFGDLAMARKLMAGICQDLPDQPGPAITLVRYCLNGSSKPGNEIEETRATELLAKIRKKWPSYDRGIFLDGARYANRRKSAEAKKLLNEYLRVSKGPAYEVAAAKRWLDILEGRAKFPGSP